MESWRKVWRVSESHLSTPSLEALLKALREDGKALLQGATTQPPPLSSVAAWDLEAGDPWVYCFWADADFDLTVGEAEEQFAKMCFTVDQNMGEPGGCRWFLNWWDDSPRGEVRRLLAEEVIYNLTCRYLARGGLEGVVRQDCPLPLEPGRTPPQVLADWLLEKGYENTAGRVRALAR